MRIENVYYIMYKTKGYMTEFWDIVWSSYFPLCQTGNKNPILEKLEYFIYNHVRNFTYTIYTFSLFGSIYIIISQNSDEFFKVIFLFVFFFKKHMPPELFFTMKFI